MAANPHSFTPVKLGLLNVESSYERFYKTHQGDVPAIAFWRVNLTALSQKYNLYFIATRENVQVYQPDFPSQRLGHKPSLTILPHLSNPHASGFIGRFHPHSINHLIVGNLGTQEILLLSTDSGNVSAYYTSAINAAIEKDAYRFSADGNADFVGVRPFFTQWVHESAWGLAIHCEGRMIAVSANTPHHVQNDDPSSKITVFAFALTTPEACGGPDEHEADEEIELDSTEWKTWKVSTGTDPLDSPTRDRNYKITLGGLNGHKDNVPCVNFVNGPEDKAGSWLLSTDIDGQMKLWQIWAGKCFRTWDLTNHRQVSNPWSRLGEAGWSVAALDIEAFRPARTTDEFLGHYRAPPYYGYRSSGDSFDLTNIASRFVPNSSNFHPSIPDPPEELSEDDEHEVNTETVELDEDDERHITAAGLEAEPTIPSPTAHSPSSQEPIRASGADTVVETSDDEFLSDLSEDDSDLQEDLSEVEAGIDGIDELSDDRDEDESPDPDGTDDSPDSLRSATSASSYNPRTSDEGGDVQEGSVSTRSTSGASVPSDSLKMKQKLNYMAPTHRSKPGGSICVPQIALIQCSTSHVRLFTNPTSDYPHIFCGKILQQTLPPRLEDSDFSRFDRLCMVQQIPELGIALIASQLGRCAVCSLTKRVPDGLLGLRIDWILPTKKQERAGVRPPLHVLIGVAVSPVQGQAPSMSIDPADETKPSEDWAKDRIIHGTLTTFDQSVVILGDSNTEQRPTDQLGSVLRNAPTENRAWKLPIDNEDWRPYQSSRRYRLMLTYSDMTVLTYELSRGVGKCDVRE